MTTQERAKIANAVSARIREVEALNINKLTPLLENELGMSRTIYEGKKPKKWLTENFPEFRVDEDDIIRLTDGRALGLEQVKKILSQKLQESGKVLFSQVPQILQEQGKLLYGQGIDYKELANGKRLTEWLKETFPGFAVSEDNLGFLYKEAPAPVPVPVPVPVPAPAPVGSADEVRQMHAFSFMNWWSSNVKLLRQYNSEAYASYDENKFKADIAHRMAEALLGAPDAMLDASGDPVPRLVFDTGLVSAEGRNIYCVIGINPRNEDQSKQYWAIEGFCYPAEKGEDGLGEWLAERFPAVVDQGEEDSVDYYTLVQELEGLEQAREELIPLLQDFLAALEEGREPGEPSAPYIEAYEKAWEKFRGDLQKFPFAEFEGDLTLQKIREKIDDRSMIYQQLGQAVAEFDALVDGVKEVYGWLRLSAKDDSTPERDRELIHSLYDNLSESLSLNPFEEMLEHYRALLDVMSAPEWTEAVDARIEAVSGHFSEISYRLAFRMLVGSDEQEWSFLRGTEHIGQLLLGCRLDDHRARPDQAREERKPLDVDELLEMAVGPEEEWVAYWNAHFRDGLPEEEEERSLALGRPRPGEEPDEEQEQPEADFTYCSAGERLLGEVGNRNRSAERYFLLGLRVDAARCVPALLALYRREDRPECFEKIWDRYAGLVPPDFEELVYWLSIQCARAPEKAVAYARKNIHLLYREDCLRLLLPAVEQVEGKQAAEPLAARLERFEACGEPNAFEQALIAMDAGKVNEFAEHPELLQELGYSEAETAQVNQAAAVGNYPAETSDYETGLRIFLFQKNRNALAERYLWRGIASSGWSQRCVHLLLLLAQEGRWEECRALYECYSEGLSVNASCRQVYMTALIYTDPVKARPCIRGSLPECLLLAYSNEAVRTIVGEYSAQEEEGGFYRQIEKLSGFLADPFLQSVILMDRKLREYAVQREMLAEMGMSEAQIDTASTLYKTDNYPHGTDAVSVAERVFRFVGVYRGAAEAIARFTLPDFGAVSLLWKIYGLLGDEPEQFELLVEYPELRAEHETAYLRFLFQKERYEEFLRACPQEGVPEGELQGQIFIAKLKMGQGEGLPLPDISYRQEEWIDIWGSLLLRTLAENRRFEDLEQVLFPNFEHWMEVYPPEKLAEILTADGRLGAEVLIRIQEDALAQGFLPLAIYYYNTMHIGSLSDLAQSYYEETLGKCAGLDVKDRLAQIRKLKCLYRERSGELDRQLTLLTVQQLLAGGGDKKETAARIAEEIRGCAPDRTAVEGLLRLLEGSDLCYNYLIYTSLSQLAGAAGMGEESLRFFHAAGRALAQGQKDAFQQFLCQLYLKAFGSRSFPEDLCAEAEQICTRVAEQYKNGTAILCLFYLKEREGLRDQADYALRYLADQPSDVLGDELYTEIAAILNERWPDGLPSILRLFRDVLDHSSLDEICAYCAFCKVFTTMESGELMNIHLQLQGQQDEKRLLSKTECDAALKALFTEPELPDYWLICKDLPLQDEPVGYAKYLYLASEKVPALWKQCAAYCKKYEQFGLLLPALVRWSEAENAEELQNCRMFLEECVEEDPHFFRHWPGAPEIMELVKLQCRHVRQTESELHSALRSISLIAIRTESREAMKILYHYMGSLLFGSYCNLGVVVLCHLMLDGRISEAKELLGMLSQVVTSMRYRALVDELAAMPEDELSRWMTNEENVILLRLVLPDGNQPRLENINLITYNGIMSGHIRETAQVLSHLLTLFPNDYGIHNALFALCTYGFDGSLGLLHQSLRGMVCLNPAANSMPYYRRNQKQNAILLAGLNAVMIAQGRMAEADDYDFNVDAGELYRRHSVSTLSYSEAREVSDTQNRVLVALRNHRDDEFQRFCQAYLSCVTGNWKELVSDAWKDRRDISMELNVELPGMLEIGFSRSILELMLPMEKEERKEFLQWLMPMVSRQTKQCKQTRQLKFAHDFFNRGYFELLSDQEDFLPLGQLLNYPFEEYSLFPIFKEEVLLPAVRSNTKHLFPLAWMTGALVNDDHVQSDLSKEADNAFRNGLDERANYLYRAMYELNKTFSLVHRDYRVKEKNQGTRKPREKERIKEQYESLYRITGLFAGVESVILKVRNPSFHVWSCINLVMTLACSPRADEVLRLTRYMAPGNARVAEAVLTVLDPSVSDEEKLNVLGSFQNDVQKLYLCFVGKHPYNPSYSMPYNQPWFLKELSTAELVNKQYVELAARLASHKDRVVRGFVLTHLVLVENPANIRPQAFQQKDPSNWWIRPQITDENEKKKETEIPSFAKGLSAITDDEKIGEYLEEHDRLPNLRDNFQKKLALSERIYRIGLGKEVSEAEQYGYLMQYGVDYYYAMLTSDNPEGAAKAHQAIMELVLVPNHRNIPSYRRSPLEEAVRNTALFDLLKSYASVREMAEDYVRNRTAFHRMRDMLDDAVLVSCVSQIYKVLDDLGQSYAVVSQGDTASLREALSAGYRMLEEIGMNRWMELKNRLQMLINEEINALDQKPVLTIKVLSREGLQPEYGFLYGQVQNDGQDVAENITLQANYGDGSRSKQYVLERLEPGAKAVFEVDYNMAPGTATMQYHLGAAYSHKGRLSTATPSKGTLLLGDVETPDFPTRLYDTQNAISFSVNEETGEVYSENFFGRSKETAELRSLVQGEQFSDYRSAIVYGIRRTGKTSLLNYLETYISVNCKDTVCVKIDCQGLPPACIQYVFIDKVLAEAGRLLPEVQGTEAWDRLKRDWALPQGSADRDPYNLDLFYRDLKDAMGGKGLFLIIDEVDRLFQRIEDTQEAHSSSLDNGLFGSLSTILCSDKCRFAVHFVLCGSNWLIRYASKGEPLQQMFQRFGDSRIEVGKLPERDARELLTKPYREYREVEITPEALEWIWNYTGGLVWFTKLLGNYALARAKRHKRSVVYPSDVQAELASILNDGNCRQFYEGCYETGPERRVIDAMQSLAAKRDAYVHVRSIAALLGWEVEPVEQALKTLRELRVVESHPLEQQSYRFELDIYRRYFRTESSRFERVPEEPQVFLAKEESAVQPQTQRAAQAEPEERAPDRGEAAAESPARKAEEPKNVQISFDETEWW